MGRAKAKPGKKKTLARKRTKKTKATRTKGRKIRPQSVHRAISLISHLLDKRKKAFSPIIYSKNGRKLVEKPARLHVLHYFHKHSERLMKGFSGRKKT